MTRGQGYTTQTLSVYKRAGVYYPNGECSQDGRDIIDGVSRYRMGLRSQFLDVLVRGLEKKKITNIFTKSLSKNVDKMGGAKESQGAESNDSQGAETKYLQGV